MSLNRLFLVHISVLIFALLLVTYYGKFSISSYVLSFWTTSDKKITFELHQLARYNGIDSDKIYIALLGVIYDVSTSYNHYGKGAPYHYFAGKDGSKAFITGDFEDDSNENNHVIDLSCADLSSLLNWRKTFKQKYKAVGVLNGRFFDANGEKTSYSKELSRKLQECKVENNRMKLQDRKYPPCNVEWSLENGSRVWCTDSSGGIKREWVGVPRLMYVPEKNTKHCVCVNLNNGDNTALLREYSNCSPTSTSCKVNED